MAVRQMLVADRYRLLEPVGAGGMGRVWLARDEMLHRDVAVKEVVPPTWMSDAEQARMRDRTLREARSAARLNHPHVVRIYDVVHAEGLSWIVMEYVQSRSLHQVLKEDGPYEPAVAARIGLAVLDALDAAHRAGVLHRDVKPHNVLIGTDGRVVLTDFGLATFVGDGSVTAPGLIVGSPQYVSPERARDGASTVESDLWSLGATLYAAVEGRSPYARETAMATLAALATEPPDPPVRAGPLAAVLDGLLRYEPATRLTVPEIDRRLRMIVFADPREIPFLPRQDRLRKPRKPSDHAVFKTPSEPVLGSEPAGEGAVPAASGRARAAVGIPHVPQPPVQPEGTPASAGHDRPSPRQVRRPAASSGVPSPVPSPDARRPVSRPVPRQVSPAPTETPLNRREDPSSPAASRGEQMGPESSGDGRGRPGPGDRPATPMPALTPTSGLSAPTAPARPDLGPADCTPGDVEPPRPADAGPAVPDQVSSPSEKSREPGSSAAEAPGSGVTGEPADPRGPAEPAPATTAEPRPPGQALVPVGAGPAGSGSERRSHRRWYGSAASIRVTPARLVLSGLVVLLLGGSLVAGYVAELDDRPQVFLPSPLSTQRPAATAPETVPTSPPFLPESPAPSANTMPPASAAGPPPTSVPGSPAPGTASAAVPTAPGTAASQPGAVPSVSVAEGGPSAQPFSPVICDSPPPASLPSTPLRGARRGVNGWTLQAGWSYFSDGSGFHIAVPDGWTHQRIGSTHCFRSPRGARVMTVDTGRDPAADPAMEARAAERRLAASGGVPGYELISVAPVPLLHRAADLEYRYRASGGVARHATARWFVIGSSAYVIGWSTPEKTWKSDLTRIQMVRSTFYSSAAR